MEAGVGGERRQLREALAKGVVYVERPRGVADGHVDLETGHKLTAGDRPVLGADAGIALGIRELALGGGERVDARGCGQREALAGGREIGPARGERRDGLGNRFCRRCEDLDLRGGKLALEPEVAVEHREHGRGGGRQVQGLGVQQHHLFLEPDRERLGRVEDLPEAAGLEMGIPSHVSEPPVTRTVVVPGVLRPPSDCHLLIAVMRELGLARDATVLDVFAGSGAIAVAAALAGAREVVAVDVSRRAVLNARLNAALNGVRIRALRGDLFEPVAGARFDLVVANPPYIPSESDDLPSHGRARAWDGGADGRALLDRLCDEVSPTLTPGGSVLIVQSDLPGESETLDRLAANGLTAEVLTRRRGPLGPIVRSRTKLLEGRGILDPGQRSEELLVIRGSRLG